MSFKEEAAKYFRRTSKIQQPSFVASTILYSLFWVFFYFSTVVWVVYSSRRVCGLQRKLFW